MTSAEAQSPADCAMPATYKLTQDPLIGAALALVDVAAAEAEIGGSTVRPDF